MQPKRIVLVKKIQADAFCQQKDFWARLDKQANLLRSSVWFSVVGTTEAAC